MGVYLLFALGACKPESQDNSRQPKQQDSSLEVITHNRTKKFLTDIKAQTGLDLPNTCVLLQINDDKSRLNEIQWVIKTDDTNQVQLPKSATLIDDTEWKRDEIKLFELAGNILIKRPDKLYKSDWDISNSPCNATLVITTNAQYLLLRRLY